MLIDKPEKDPQWYLQMATTGIQAKKMQGSLLHGSPNTTVLKPLLHGSPNTMVLNQQLQ